MSGRKRLVELKARYEDPGRARALLAEADSLGVHRQTDTYYSLGERRLKLREVDGRGGGQLIYYERPDAADVKASTVLLYEVADVGVLRDILGLAMGVQAVVRKRREIYRHEGVQVHLDDVEGLGRFLEFELAVEDTAESVAEGTAHLETLRRAYGVEDEDLMASSYSDLLAE